MLAAVIAMTLQTPAIIPAPVSLRTGEGTFTLNSSTKLILEGDATEAARRLRSYLGPATGL